PSVRHSCSLLYCSASDPQLHSFPTRRSSDLQGRASLRIGKARQHAVGLIESQRAMSRICFQPRWDLLPHDAGLNPSVTQYFGIRDRKSTRLNSSHVSISYAVFCLKKTSTLYP